MACCWRGGSTGPCMHDDIHPIYCYLKRSGWDDSLELLKCTTAKLPDNFALNGDGNDQFKVIMRPIDKPTELFEALQMRDWGAALDCLHRKPTEAKTWIYRETDFPDSKMMWKVLPLHASIAIGAPAYLTLELLQAYPDAARKWDLNRCLPIHIAASRIDLDVDGERILHKLLKAFPESASVENGKGKVPIELAYGAQLRKDKQKKINTWSIDTKEQEGGGFELQLEMCDVMESFKADDKNVDPSTWSLGTIPTTSSFSTKSESTTYSFLNNGSDAKLLSTIPESTCDSPTNLNSSDESSESSGSRSSIGFKSIHVNGENQTSNSTLPFSFSTTSSQSSGVRSLQRPSILRKPSSQSEAKGILSVCSTGSLGGPSFSFGDGATNVPPKEDKISNENDSSILNTRKKQQNKKGFMISQSFELPPKPPRSKANSSRSLPSLRRIFTRSRTIEEKTSVCGDSHAAEDTECKGSRELESIVLSDPMTGAPKLASSFDLPSNLVLYSSPARSLPSPRRIHKLSSRSSDEKKTCINEVDTVSDCSLPSSAQSLNLLQSQKVYMSPQRSLPLDAISSTQNIDKKVSDASESSCSFNNDASGRAQLPQKSKSLDLDESISVSFRLSAPEQRQKGWRKARSSSEQSMRNSSITPPPEALSEQYLSSSSSCKRECDHNKSTKVIKHTSSGTVATETSEPSEEDDIILIVTESYDGDNDDEMITEELRLLAVVRNRFDEKSQAGSVSTESLSVCTQDPCIVDFIEEAISNIGREGMDVTSVLNEMRANNIETIEDLLKVGLNEFSTSLTDKELAVEMRRLLDEPNYAEAS
ncbi:hypothetical protein ACHAWO_007874 [Cyclotella atomus]|uniref:Uncharacterized protein n=1 Tax=Cyclotella atomus TaxID=382360 RepID=A0ABD3N1H3_9STRA